MPKTIEDAGVKTGNQTPGNLEDSVLELLECVRELGNRMTTSEERMEKIKVALSGGEIDGKRIGGVHQSLTAISERLTEVERVALNSDFGVGTRLPNDVYEGLTPAMLFQALLASGFQSASTAYASVMIGRGNEGSREARLRDLITACHHAVTVCARIMPDLVSTAAKS